MSKSPENQHVLKSTFKSAEAAKELEQLLPPQANRLKGTLHKPDLGGATEVNSEQPERLREGQLLIQRDSGHRWEVTRIAPDEREGRNGVMRAYLHNLDKEPGRGGDKLIKPLDELLAQLDEEGSAWLYS